ncbi:conserved hypothetical protein [Oenococcus oeni]|nr:conserved hypothetical protein [Oenococcus oeni]
MADKKDEQEKVNKKDEEAKNTKKPPVKVNEVERKQKEQD